MYAHWTPDTIRWYLNAERHTGFFRSLAGHIGPMPESFNVLVKEIRSLGIDIDLERN